MTKTRASAGTRTTPPRKTKKIRTNADGQPETPKTREKRKRNTARAKANAAAKRAKPFAPVLNTEPVDKVAEAVLNTEPVDEVAKAAPKKQVVGGKKNKRKQTTPVRARLVTLGSGEHTNSDDSDFVISEEDGDGDGDSKAPEVEEAVHNDSSEDDEDSTDSVMDNFHRDAARRRLQAAAQLKLFEDEMKMEEVRRAEFERLGALLTRAEDPPNDATPTASTSHARPDARMAVPRAGLLNEESESIVPREESHVRKRIVLFVKTDLFRKIKFVNSASMFQRAFRKVIEFEKVRPQMHYQFQMTYEKTFNLALNQKRSSCEQAGLKITRKTIADFKKRGEDFFTMEELCKLRRATTDRERKAFFWFYDSFLECVCGAGSWRTAKKTSLVSEARDGDNSKIVSISDEAFGLLLIDNYLDKWKIKAANVTAGNESVDSSTEPVNDNNTTEAEADGGQKKKKISRLPGKFTEKQSGKCKYSGWSHEGMKRFNELHQMVKEDRACPQSEGMERELLAFCRTQAGMKNAGDEQQDGTGGGAGNNRLPTAEAMMPVEAAWDSDDD